MWMYATYNCYIDEFWSINTGIVDHLRDMDCNYWRTLYFNSYNNALWANIGRDANIVNILKSKCNIWEEILVKYQMQFWNTINKQYIIEIFRQITMRYSILRGYLGKNADFWNEISKIENILYSISHYEWSIIVYFGGFKHIWNIVSNQKIIIDIFKSNKSIRNLFIMYVKHDLFWDEISKNDDTINMFGERHLIRLSVEAKNKTTLFWGRIGKAQLLNTIKICLFIRLFLMKYAIPS